MKLLVTTKTCINLPVSNALSLAVAFLPSNHPHFLLYVNCSVPKYYIITWLIFLIFKSKIFLSHRFTPRIIWLLLLFPPIVLISFKYCQDVTDHINSNLNSSSILSVILIHFPLALCSRCTSLLGELWAGFQYCVSQSKIIKYLPPYVFTDSFHWENM